MSRQTPMNLCLALISDGLIVPGKEDHVNLKINARKDHCMSICKQSHRYNTLFISLPHDQGGEGRHKCCGCAYDQGYLEGLARTGQVWVDLAALPDSQAGTVRHKSPQAAFADGYRDGVRESYRHAG
ncbi:hypothetical protein ACV8T5_22375 [Citrobacter freundii]|uniref:hypothetical protein n=1 Tax=Citrobacter freundii complex TaxID=1344959 RepID=UPI0028BFC2D7|nr:hypothetical protein [Citrobacter braakii]MDT7239212.1 hypothetical protein [Citrobacter freundii]